MSRASFRVDNPTKDSFTASIERMYFVFHRFEKVCLSFSGGKDSTVILRIAEMVARDLERTFEVVFFDDETVDSDTIQYCTEVYQESLSNPTFNFHWMCVEIQHTLRGVSKNDRSFITTWDPDQRDIWFRQPPPWAHTRETLGFIPESVPHENSHFEKYIRVVYTNIIGWGDKTYSRPAGFGEGGRSDPCLCPNRSRG